MTWFTSDLHLNDKKMLSFRQFKDIKEMNDILINNYNSLIKPSDTVYILGDIGVGPKATIEKQITKLNGTKILIKGNHDKDYSKSKIFEHISEMEHIIIHNKQFILCHYCIEALKLKNTITLNGHGHVSREWNEEQLQLKNNRYNVGVDANEFFPVSSEQIIDFFS